MDIKVSILVFDSGVGGLSVYHEIRQLMPEHHYIYAIDNEGFPYGNKTNRTISRRVSAYLDAITQQHTIDLGVVACNTVSTTCLAALRQRYGFPLVGVVPAIKPAVQVTRNRRIGLLATKRTLTNPYTAKLINQFASTCHIELLGLPELAVLAENKLHGKPISMEKLAYLLASWLNLPLPLDTIVLGCTHYPLIVNELRALFPTVAFIDSGKAVAQRVLTLSSSSPKIDCLKKNDENLVITTIYDQEINQLRPILKEYNLTSLKTITLGAV